MFVRLYTGKDGQSHLEDMEPPTGTVENSPVLGASSVTFRRSEPGDFIDWHPAPRKQYIITLSGEVEIGLGDGTLRRFGAGDVMLADDLTGQGHTTRSVGDEPRISAAIPLTD